MQLTYIASFCACLGHASSTKSVVFSIKIIFNASPKFKWNIAMGWDQQIHKIAKCAHPWCCNARLHSIWRLFFLSLRCKTAYRMRSVMFIASKLLTGCCGFSQADFSSDVRIKWANKKVMSHSLIASSLYIAQHDACLIWAYGKILAPHTARKR